MPIRLDNIPVLDGQTEEQTDGQKRHNNIASCIPFLTWVSMLKLIAVGKPIRYEFGRSIHQQSVIPEILRTNWTIRVLPFQVTQGHYDLHGSISYL